MKRTTTLISLVVCLGLAAQQNNAKKENEWFDELMESYYDGDYMTAYLGFGQFVEKYPKSELVPRAVFNQASLLRNLGKNEEAKVIFKQIMQSEYDEYDSYGGIMEQYTLYKNRSAKHLAEIFLEEGDFDSAEKYIHLFEKVYPYKHFCGNELSANAIYTDAMYAKMYFGKGKIEKAIKKLLPHMFYNGLAGNQEVIDLLNLYLPKLYSEDELKQLWAISIENFKEKTSEEGLLKFLGVKIPVFTYQLDTSHGYIYPDSKGQNQEDIFARTFMTHPVLSNYVSE